MLQSYHQQICQRALENHFSPRALAEIIAANLAQDGLRGQIGHPEFHFDDSAFAAGEAYMAAQRQIIWDTLESKAELSLTWQALGRLTHAAQDFYAHTNYVGLWLSTQPGGKSPTPSEVEALAPGILNHPELRSGKIYFWDWLAFVPGLYPLALRLLPENSHTHMNLDSPKQGALFPYAFEAAVKRTYFEYEQIVQGIDPADLPRFVDG